MDIQVLCGRFGLGAPGNAAPVRPGTVSQVWRVAAEKGEFFVRSLTGPEQGRREWTIYRHLTARNFRDMPDILTACDGQPMTELGGVWYQVQRFCPGAMPDPARPGVPAKMAALAVRLGAALADCPAVAAADRFDLAEAWARGRENWPLLGTALTVEQADREAERCCRLPQRNSQVIHGDLGPWNMVSGEDGRLLVIDFGEARMGDPCFDLASVLGGLVNDTPKARRQAAGEEFLAACGCADRAHLREQLALWAWRGLAQCACAAGRGGGDWPRMAGRMINALKWAEESL